VKEPEQQKGERHRGGEEDTGSHLDKSIKITIGHMGCVIIVFVNVSYELLVEIPLLFSAIFTFAVLIFKIAAFR
jgi:hypothetical protein